MLVIVSVHLLGVCLFARNRPEALVNFPNGIFLGSAEPPEQWFLGKVAPADYRILGAPDYLHRCMYYLYMWRGIEALNLVMHTCWATAFDCWLRTRNIDEDHELRPRERNKDTLVAGIRIKSWLSLYWTFSPGPASDLKGGGVFTPPCFVLPKVGINVVSCVETPPSLLGM